MASPSLARTLFVTLVLTACGGDKGTTDDTTTSPDTSAGPTAATTGDTAPTGTTVVDTTDATGPQTTTSGGVPCDQPEPDDCQCAPGCGVNTCVDGFWQCDCVPCGSTVTTTDSEGESTAADTTGADTTAPETTTEPGTTTGGVIACEPDPFEPLHNPACMANDECASVIHMTDCCGTIAVWGVSADVVDEFPAIEEMCAPKPICDCAPKATMADDGSVADKPDAFSVGCIDGLCQTFLP